MSVIDIIARFRAEGTAQAKDLAQSIEGIDDSAQKGTVNLGSLASGTAALGVAMGPAIAGIGLLGAGLNYSIGQAAEAEQGQAQLEAVIKSTGGAAGLTADEINEMAGSLAGVTTFGDDAILTGQNLLLTFTNIGENVFPRATETMLDMATALGTDASGSAIQLGKALNDPIAGITALTRVGVTFTAEQKEQIRVMVESGDVMGAQTVILDELSKEFGGSAAAAAATYTGRITQLKNQMGEAGEAIGMGFLPMLTTLGEKALPIVTEAVENLAIISAEQLEPALADLVETGGELVESFGEIGVTSTAVWDSVGEQIAGVNEKILLLQGYIELIRRPSGARWDIAGQFGDVGREAETAGERVEGYRLVLERLDIQQGLINEELREGKVELSSTGVYYNELVADINETTTSTQVLSGAYDYMILVAERTENQMEHYGERLGTVEEASVSLASASGVITANLEAQRAATQAADEAFAGYYGQALTATDLTFNAADSLLHFATQAGANATVLALLTIETGHYDDAQIQSMLTHAALTVKAEELGQQLADNTITTAEALAELRGLQDQMLQGINIPGLPGTISQVSTLKDELLAVEGDYQVNINVTTTGSIPDLPGGAGDNPQDPDNTTPTFGGGGSGPFGGPGRGFSGGAATVVTGGDTYITINAQGAMPGVEQVIRREVEAVMAQYGRRSEILLRTR